MEVYEMSKFSPINILNDTTQFSEDMREIYIEKFTNIGTSELCWDISRFLNDVTDINGYLCHWHTIVKSAQSCGR